MRGKNIPHADLWPSPKDAELMELLDISTKDMLAMRNAHAGFVRAAADRLPSYRTAKGSKPRGIVTVGGGGYFPPLMVSLRLLRRTGTSLPVEVFLPSDEYEEELCQIVLPALNAICRTFPAPPLNAELNISHYQFKIFSILLSSFDEVLWLDADNFPLRDVEPLFSSAPYQSTGLVTWPDIWQTSITPAYYLISSQGPVSVSSRSSTESGQLLVSKQKHWQTLLLVAYYNFYGPDHYYSILCQTGAGCGDKETFLPAAEALSLPFYAVKTPAQAVGHNKGKSNRKSNGIYRFALIQHDLEQDYRVTKELSESTGRTISQLPTSNDTTAQSPYDGVSALFLHMSTPKWDAFHVFDHVGVFDLTMDTHRNPAPAYRDTPQAVAKIKGVERMIWEEVRWVACNLEHVMGYWEGKRGHICEKVETYFRDVLNTEKGAAMGLGMKDAAMPPADFPSDKSSSIQGWEFGEQLETTPASPSYEGIRKPAAPAGS
ncbi:mannosyltransferase putative-domain-containing protein [Xylariales sp. PMI_506]|nr:mannosyltransferase putative-domain-containing protein [Xylariales sp. PMI_506]